MKRVVLNVLAAFLMMVIQTGVSSSFGIESICQFGIIAAVLTGALSMPMMSSTVSMLIFGILCDLWVSGPAGLYPFLFMIAFLCIRGVMSKFKSERVIIAMLHAGLACLGFEALQCIGYCLYYQTIQYWTIWSHMFLPDLLWTVLLTPPMLWLVIWLDRLTSRRRTSELT